MIIKTFHLFGTLLLLGYPVITANALEDPIRINSGLISGTLTGENKEVRVYRGIPFAAPPLGNLRWKPPQPVRTWQGIRTCKEFGPWSPQPKPLMGHPVGTMSEDCLYLNVWTAATTPDARLPVMFWIHGGGFTTGSGAQPPYNGATLAREGVVIVTINYRLGPFGFFAHPALSKESSQGVSGNYGLLDQIAALEWVKHNIAVFGGDPNCVTIFGESAGAASVTCLMVSPLAKGLFHRAIAESGFAGALPRLSEARNGRPALENIGLEIAQKLGCDGHQDPLPALRAKSSEEILKVSNPAQGLFGKGYKFQPVIDGGLLPDDPVVLFQTGKQHPVPFMTGTNADEGTIFLQQLPVKHTFGYRLLLKAFFKDHADKVFSLYPVASDQEIPRTLNQLITDMAFVSPARTAVQAMEKVHTQAYLYHFTRIPKGASERRLGAFHGLEIAYVFGNLNGLLSSEQWDYQLSTFMRRSWIVFAATGNPNAEGLPEWPAYEATADKYLELGSEVSIGQGLHKTACDFLEKIRAERRVAEQ